MVAKQHLEEFFKKYEESLITPGQLKKLNCTLEDDWFKDGPPCLQTLASFGIEKGDRSEVLLEMTRYLKLRFPDDWENKVSEYNTKFFKPKGTGYLIKKFNQQ